MARAASRQLVGSDAYQRWARRMLHLELRARKAAHDVRWRLQPPTSQQHDPYRLLYVDPQRVTHLLRERLPWRFAGHSPRGAWDAGMMPLAATALHRGLRQRFLEERAWAETDLHPRRYTRCCENEPPQYERYTEAEFLRRGAALDRLYASLREGGYLDHRQRGEPPGTDMTVAVTRDGTWARHAGGMHRLIMAQLIGLPDVPVRVFAVHARCRGTPADPFRDDRADA